MIFKAFISVIHGNTSSIDYQVKKPVKLWSGVLKKVAETVRNLTRFGSNVNTVSQSPRGFHAGEHYCNSPFKPVTGSEG